MLFQGGHVDVESASLKAVFVIGRESLLLLFSRLSLRFHHAKRPQILSILTYTQ
jgi:hypothetical protein